MAKYDAGWWFGENSAFGTILGQSKFADGNTSTTNVTGTATVDVPDTVGHTIDKDQMTMIAVGMALFIFLKK